MRKSAPLLFSFLLSNKGKGKVVWAPRHEGVLGEWRYSSTHSLTSALDGRWMFSFIARPLYPQGKSLWYQLDRRLDGYQNRSGRGGEQKNSQPSPGMEPWNPDHTARGPALYRLSYRGSSCLVIVLFFDKTQQKEWGSVLIVLLLLLLLLLLLQLADLFDCTLIIWVRILEMLSEVLLSLWRHRTSNLLPHRYPGVQTAETWILPFIRKCYNSNDNYWMEETPW
jgi:hypothetical protein